MSDVIKTTASLIHAEVSSRCKKFPYSAALEIAHKLNGIQSSNHKKPSAGTTKSSVDLADVFEAIEKARSALRDAQNVIAPYLPGSDEYSQLINMPRRLAKKRRSTGAIPGPICLRSTPWNTRQEPFNSSKYSHHPKKGSRKLIDPFIYSIRSQFVVIRYF